jgi:hypothetical protein
MASGPRTPRGTADGPHRFQKSLFGFGSGIGVLFAGAATGLSGTGKGKASVAVRSFLSKTASRPRTARRTHP